MVAVYDVLQKGRENWLQGDSLWSLQTHLALQNARMHMHAHKNTYTLSSKSQGTVGLRSLVELNPPRSLKNQNQKLGLFEISKRELTPLLIG